MTSSIERTNVETIKELEIILQDEETNPAHFHLNAGRVFRCRVIQRSQPTDKDLLMDGDILLFNFHHAIFDYSSKSIFLTDLKQAYSIGMLDHHVPNYIDYAIWERDINNHDTLSGRQFWNTILKDYDDHLQLPYDRHLSRHIHTYQTSVVSFTLPTPANQMQTTLFQVYLSAYYIFLYKLTYSQDLMIDTCMTDRPRHQFMQTIGVFDRFVPLRFFLNHKKV